MRPGQQHDRGVLAKPRHHATHRSSWRTPAASPGWCAQELSPHPLPGLHSGTHDAPVTCCALHHITTTDYDPVLRYLHPAHSIALKGSATSMRALHPFLVLWTQGMNAPLRAQRKRRASLMQQQWPRVCALVSSRPGTARVRDAAVRTGSHRETGAARRGCRCRWRRSSAARRASCPAGRP